MTQKEQLRKRKKPLQKSDSESKGEEASGAPASPVLARKNSDVTSPTVKTEQPEAKPAAAFKVS